MPRPAERRFHFAYEIADYAARAVRGETDSSPAALKDAIVDDQFLRRIARPQKDTLLHGFIECMRIDIIDGVLKLPELQLEYIVQNFDLYGEPRPPWLNEKEVERHVHELERLLRRINVVVARDAFHLLFADRRFLLDFQHLVSGCMTSLRRSDHPDVLERDGILKRCTLPTWLRRGVFFRDQGFCQRCGKDLSGLLRVTDDAQLDHIVPLAKGGTNDPTNFQLMCEKCNQAKHAGPPVTSDRYVPYWEVP